MSNHVDEHIEEEVPEVNRQPKKAPSTVSSMVDKVTKAGVFENGLPVKYLPYVLFLAVLAIVYIGNAHFSEKLDLKHQKMKVELEGLKAKYNTLKADYMFDSKQSEVEKRVVKQEIQNTKQPPIWLKEKKNEY